VKRNWQPPEHKNPTQSRTGYEFLVPQPEEIRFLRDDSLYFLVYIGKNQNNYDQKVINKYKIGGDSILNIFVQVHHPDSQKVKTYRVNSQGIALGNHLKMAGLFELGWTPWGFKGLLNHEVGHILGLSHAWGWDGCDDTPEHKNKCWSWTPEPPCNVEASNNVMDYNSEQNAFTNCQMGRILMNLANERYSARKFLRPDWCKNDEKQLIYIRDSVVWSGARDLNGGIRIEDGGVLKIRCRTSMPPDSKISVAPGGVLILDNCRLHQACGQVWKGIEMEEKGRKKGKIEILGQIRLENLPANPKTTDEN
jgi:hypothetical protein